jgi:hypothetical protein
MDRAVLKQNIEGFSKLGIGIEQTNTGTGLLAFIISVRYRTEKILNFIGLVRNWTGLGIVSFFILVPY